MKIKNVLKYVGVFLIGMLAFFNQEAEARVTCTYTSKNMPDIIVNYEPDSNADSFTLNPDVPFNNVQTEDYILYYRIVDRANDDNSEWYIASRSNHNWVPQHLLPLKSVEKEVLNFVSYEKWVKQKECFPTLDFYYNIDYSAVIFTREGLGSMSEYSDFLAEENEYALYKLEAYVDSELIVEKEDLKIGDKIQCGDIKIPYLFPYVVNLFIVLLQIAVPVIMILLGSFDLLKSVMAQKEDEIKKAQQTFIRRLVVGACIFLVFVLTRTIISFASPEDFDNNTWNCVDCFINGNCK